MVKKLVCFIFLIFVFITGCTVKLKYADLPIEPPKEIEISEKVPYPAEIRVNKNKELTHKDGDVTTIYPVGAMLNDAVNYYLKPMFKGEEYKNIIIEVDAVDVKRKLGGGFIDFPVCVEMTAKASLYIDNIIASLGIFAKGEGCDKGNFGTPSAANKAAIEAVKKMRKEIYETLTFPGKSATAIQDFIKKNPNNLVGFLALANLSRLTKNYNEAIAAAKRAIEISPQDQATHKLLGLTYKDLNQYAEAINYLKKAMEINPKDLTVHHAIYDIYYAKGKYKEAVDTLKSPPLLHQLLLDKLPLIWLWVNLRRP